MHKCYTFLIFMVLLLPSLGLSRWVRRKGRSGRVTGWGEGAVPAPTSPPKRGTPYLGASSAPHHTSPSLQPGPLLPLAL